ncbi:flagellar biosynthetic protein FliO [Anaeromyxobacter paludicola]|uniref:Flagellar protein n=1 Tax=Anaeromyxobacter paludicola TaxID=2918171 RepID=A0ABM7X833_9BACT|nr:flagellar biosynthetic protein FliO [Anaeromyxobacter paludicola]BDG07993.1 hypothetical protein AMPC_11060 [Anaeromyxobacter paludicola]
MLSALAAAALPLALLASPAQPAPRPAPAPAAVPAPALAPPLPAAAAPAAEPARELARPLELPASSGGLGSVAVPALLLLALAAAALLLARKKARAGGLVQVLETASLGPRRSIVVARVGDELLVLGSSERGIQLLSSRPCDPALAPLAAPPPLAAPGAAAAPAWSAAPREKLSEVAGSVRGLFEKLSAHRAGAPPPPPPDFAALLAESAEDEELRRKLATGQRGQVR